MSVVYLNGDLMPAEKATVSVFDRGFLLGDGVYEVIPAFGGRLFRLKEHLDRLQNSLDAIRLKNPLSYTQWESVLNQVVEKNSTAELMPELIPELNQKQELSIYLQVTRGVAARDHAFPANTAQGVFVMANPITKFAESYFANGVNAITVPDNRWQRCNIKAISLLPNVLLRQQAVEQGAAEAILIRDGYVTEGAASNVFVVHQGKIITPPKGQYILPGITRDLVLELAIKHKMNCVEGAISQEILLNADEIWLTSSTKEVLPVSQLDDKAVGFGNNAGKPGPVWKAMVDLYRDYKKTLIAQPKV